MVLTLSNVTKRLGRLRVKKTRGQSGATYADNDQLLVAELESALAPDRVRNDAVERSLLAHDSSVFDQGLAGPVCFPTSTAEVVSIMEIAQQFDRPVTPRGAGTGLTGGAVPLGAPIMVAMTKMDAILEVDVDNRFAWVEPGVVNLDLTNHLQSLGFHFAPDPSSQQVCTIGGNIANNAGGPHCLAYGVTGAHTKAIEVVLTSGEVVMLGGLDPNPVGYDLRGAFVGSEGTLGIATKIAVAITPNPPVVRTLLMPFGSVEEAANTVSSVVASGIVPAAMEVMDQRITVAVENYVSAGYPTDAAAVLLVEVDGMDAGTAADADQIEAIGRANGATSVRVAVGADERALLWKGRKTAFGAVAQIAPDYYLHDTVVPRSELASVLNEIYEIADRHDVLVMNVFHAGDGNLHPLLVFDGREEGILERIHAAGREILSASIDAGGTLSGEHGVGVEKRDYMDQMFTNEDLDHQARLRRSYDPQCRANPGKVLPTGHSCADIAALERMPKGVWG